MARKITVHTREQVEFVRANMGAMSCKTMAQLLEIENWDAQRIKENIRDGIYIPGGDIPRSRAVKYLTKPEPPPKKMIRPPAVYLNRSHEETINHWLNYPI